MLNQLSESNIDDVVHAAANKLSVLGINLGENQICEMNDMLSSFLEERCSIAIMEDSEVDTDEGKKILQVAFDIKEGTAHQQIWVTDERYDEFKLISGLADGSLVTTLDHDNEVQFIKEDKTDKCIATILSQEVDGEYVDYR